MKVDLKLPLNSHALPPFSWLFILTIGWSPIRRSGFFSTHHVERTIARAYASGGLKMEADDFLLAFTSKREFLMRQAGRRSAPRGRRGHGTNRWTRRTRTRRRRTGSVSDCLTF